MLGRRVGLAVGFVAVASIAIGATASPSDAPSPFPPASEDADLLPDPIASLSTSELDGVGGVLAREECHLRGYAEAAGAACHDWARTLGYASDNDERAYDLAVDPSREAVLAAGYVIHPQDGGRASVASFDAGTGKVDWTYEADGRVFYRLVQDPASSTVYALGDGSPGPLVAAIDTNSGILRWTHGDGFTRDLTVYDAVLDDGQLLAAASAPSYEGGGTLFIGLDAETGATLWSDEPAGLAEDLTAYEVDVVGDEMLVAGYDGDGLGLMGYDLQAREPSWTRSDPAYLETLPAMETEGSQAHLVAETKGQGSVDVRTYEASSGTLEGSTTTGAPASVPNDVEGAAFDTSRDVAVVTHENWISSDDPSTATGLVYQGGTVAVDTSSHEVLWQHRAESPHDQPLAQDVALAEGAACAFQASMIRGVENPADLEIHVKGLRVADGQRVWSATYDAPPGFHAVPDRLEVDPGTGALYVVGEEVPAGDVPIGVAGPVDFDPDAGGGDWVLLRYDPVCPSAPLSLG